MLPILTNTKDDPGHRDNYLDNCRKSQEMLKWKIQALARSVQKLLKFTKEEWQTGQNRYATIFDLKDMKKWSGVERTSVDFFLKYQNLNRVDLVAMLL